MESAIKTRKSSSVKRSANRLSSTYRNSHMTDSISVGRNIHTGTMYNPIRAERKFKKIQKAEKTHVSFISTHPAEIVLGLAIGACLTVVTNGAALPVLIVAVIAIALW